MKKRINEKHLEICKCYLNGRTYEQLSIEYSRSVSTIRNCISTVFGSLVRFMNFKEKNIEYPHIENTRGGWMFRNALEYKKFWLKTISDYENNVQYPTLERTEKPYSFIGVARKVKRSEVFIYCDGVTLSCDTLPLSAYSLDEGCKYSITIQKLK